MITVELTVSRPDTHTDFSATLDINTVGIVLVYLSHADHTTFAINGFHGAWLHFQRARVGVCVYSSCVQTTG